MIAHFVKFFVLYRILERVGARALSSHLRTFCDYFVHEFSNSGHGVQVNRCIEAVNDLIWKYHVFPIDRFILCLVLRNYEGSEAQVSFLIIQLLLVKSSEMQARVKDFLKENTPEHWKMTDWYGLVHKNVKLSHVLYFTLDYG